MPNNDGKFRCVEDQQKRPRVGSDDDANRQVLLDKLKSGEEMSESDKSSTLYLILRDNTELKEMMKATLNLAKENSSKIIQFSRTFV